MKTRTGKLACVIVAVASLATSGCFSVSARAPYGRDVKVLPADAPVEVVRKAQKWYILWGMIPLATSDDPKSVIEEERLTEVRVVVEDTLVDVLTGGIISLLSIGMVSPTTVVVEGNRGPAPTVAAPRSPS